MTDDDGSIRFTAGVDLQAATGDGPKAPTFSIHAYSGGPLNLSGFEHPVTVDLASASIAREDIPVLLDHDDEKLVGQGKATIDASGIKVQGKITGTDGPALHVTGHAKNGFRWQASIGGARGRQEVVPQGRSVSVNGRTVNGPAIISRGFILKEVSFVPIGADQTSAVSIAAKGKEMSAINGGDGASTNDAVLRERRRISEVREMAKDYPSIQARATDEGWDLERTELEVLRAAGPRKELEALHASREERSRNCQARVNGTGELEAKAIAASMLISSGLSESTVGKYYDQQTMNAAVSSQFRGAGIQSAFRAVLRAAGRYDDLASHRFTDETLQASYEASGYLRAAGFSTISLPGILGDYLNKFLLAAYEAITPTWQLFCAIRPLDDFLPQHIFRLIDIGEFEQIGPTGELHDITLQEQDYQVQASTYGCIITLARTQIVNDSLSAFGQIAAGLGRLGILKLEEVVYTLLMSNPATAGVNFFSDTNGNYSSGGDSALSLSSLTTAEKQFKLQVDNNGKPIMLPPKTLLTGPTLAVTARQLIGSTDLLQTALQSASGAGLSNQQPSGNPFVRQLSIADSPWVENETIPGNSSTQWWLFGDPNIVAPIFAGFLNGQTHPTVQSGEASFNTLGMQFRTFFDWGVSTGDWRAGHLSAGQ